ncbi:hypothetical protein TESG_04859 [Trichophyton tonsurans CBS 112818]|uniref:Uncharacterized protein n=1 Tax=Trichophyton tonsurans (strain CBS 112818) TaxID=647933 RepID=F2S1K1_TRIT1|nr:hypothetical protein TESG_04859 [Trichophyton tonsurans CBS 112818]
MEQRQALVQRGHNAKLDMAALAVTEVLSHNGVKHGFFGSYAVAVFGGERLTHDVDIIVGEDVKAVRQQLLAGDENFYMTDANKLKFRPGQDVEVVVELLPGGKDQPIKLPDNYQHYPDHPAEPAQLPFLHPGVLVLTKLKRWMHISDSTRPASIARTANDMQDIKTILGWLIGHRLKVNFDMHPEKKRRSFSQG